MKNPHTHIHIISNNTFWLGTAMACLLMQGATPVKGSVRSLVAQVLEYNASTQLDEDTLYIPVVFHVVYANETQRISDEQVISQLDVLNEDYTRRNADSINTLPVFRTVAGRPNIRFFLAQQNETTGITRTATTHGPFANDDLHSTSLGGKDAWDTNKYLNVWIASLAPGVFGYGAAPGTPAFKDGVAVHYEYVGKNGSAKAPYHLGRTLTHEIGHWLGLQHPWGTGGCDSDDGLDDTPRQTGPSSGCDLSQTTCGSLDMIQNFMGTAEDACMNLFTRQQAARMRDVLLTQRTEVYHTESPVTGVSNYETTWNIYPNPVTVTPYAFVESTNVAFDTIELLDLAGKRVRSFQSTVNEVSLDLSGLANGIYLVKPTGTVGIKLTKLYLSVHQ